MRQKLIILSSLCWLLACNSGMESDAMKSTEEAESEITVSTANMDDADFIPEAPKSAINYSEIVSQKLQEYVELQNLIKEHPEFKSDLERELTSYTSDSLLLTNKNEVVNVSDVRILDNIPVSDSVTKVKIDFNVTSNSGSGRDSLVALLRVNRIEIDGQIFNATKLTFERLRD